MNFRFFISLRVSCFLIVFLVFLVGCQMSSYIQEEPTMSNLPTEEIVRDSTLVPSPTPVSTPSTIPSTSSPLPSLAMDNMGIEIHTLVDVDSIASSGAHWIRRNALVWHTVESEEGHRDWSVLTDLEDELQTASKQGLETILIVRGAPSWAQKAPGSFCGPVLADKMAAFASFVYDAVSRYSIPPYNVKYWELGNEPDVDSAWVPPDSIYGCWGVSGDDYFGGSYYAEMLKKAYLQIKAADPESQILVGGLLLDCDPLDPPESQPGSSETKDCTPAKFLEGILVNKGGNYFDGVSFHGYDYYAGSLGKYNNGNWHSSWDTTGPVLIAKANYLRNLLAEYGYPNKYLINTENAILCGRDGKEDICQAEDFALTKAYYLVQAFAAARAEGLRANIWYSVRGWRGSGLVNTDMQPNMAFRAFKFSAEQLEGAAYSGEVTLFPGIKGYEFNRDGVRTWLLWALDDQTHSVALPEMPAAIFDFVGTSLPLSQELQITLAPVYIQWTP